MDSRSALEDLFTGGRELLYRRGDTIIRAGDMPSGVYLISEGWIKVYCLCEDGEPNIITSLRAGDIFPLEWAVSGRLRDVTFAALDTTKVLRIPHDDFAQALRTNPAIAEAVSLKLAQAFFRLSDELENLPYRSARERVAFRLISLAACFGQAKAGKIVIGIRVPNEYIARSTNMTRETASREMSRLTQKGLIQSNNGYIIIKDLAALQTEVSKSFQWPSSSLSGYPSTA